MTVAAWFHCFAGIAGDMALASLIDAGADLSAINDGLDRLGIDGLAVQATATSRCGIAATSVSVVSNEEKGSLGERPARTYADIEALLEKAPLPDRVHRRSRDVFAALAEVEGELHGVDPHDVHFHEVGGHDAIGDVVGTCLALEHLGVDEIHASPVALGRGTTNSLHGVIPHPAPATLRLLRGMPVVGTDLDIEMTTPTGAALLAGMGAAFGGLPPMVVDASGYGAGRAELTHLPNCVQVVIGTLSVPPRGPGQPLDIIEANLDDATGEVLGHAVGALMEAGALDAWVAPAPGKKGRPSHTLSVLSDPTRSESLAALLVAETGTLGTRRWPVTRWAEARRTEEVAVAGITVRFKVSDTSAKPEYDDLAELARRSGLSLREATRQAEEARRGQEGNAAP